MKPIPEATLSWNFWNQAVCLGKSGEPRDSSKQTKGIYCEASCGFLFSYAKSITHASDYRIAVTHNLIPDIGFTNWQYFAEDITQTVQQPNFEPEKRWEYGELRLSRLNLIYKLNFRGYSYFYTYSDYGAYFGKNFKVVLLGFAYCTVVLSAMQVVVSARAMDDWKAIWCIRFSTAVIFSVFGIASGLILLFLGLFIYSYSIL